MEYIMSFLMGLHDSFSQIRGQLLLMDPLPPINKVFAIISQEEHQRKVGTNLSSSSDSTNTMAFAVKSNDSKRSGDKGNYNSNPRNSGTYKGQKKERPFCTHCQYHGHTVEKCYKIHGYPPGFQPRQRDNHSYSNNQAIVNQVSNQPSHNSYSTNQAAVNQVTSQQSSSVYPEVPQFKFNLMSVSALTKGSQFTVNFFPNYFVIQEINSKKIIGKGDKLEDLVEKKKSNSRPITGLRTTYTHQDAIVTVSLLLLLSPAISTVGAQTGTMGNGSGQYQYPNFTPSIAIIVVILVAALFLMAFFSIYIRHCSESPDGSINRVGRRGASIRSRRNAARGLDAAVIETFPRFVYSVVKGLKIGKGALECAVCLNEFEDNETLRLIPKCDHVFHPECIDAWLASHVTCPVCRANLEPQPGETLQVPELDADSESTAEIDNMQNDDVSIRICEDQDATVQEPPQVLDRNRSMTQNRPPRSRSVRSLLFGKFPRSHSTGHSLVQPGENMERFTLRLPEDVRKQVMNRALTRTTSCVVVLPRQGSSRRGYRTGGGEGSSRGRYLKRLDRGMKSDRWVFSMAPPFFSRASSVRSPRVVAADGEGTSTMTPKGSVTAVKTPFSCPEPKADETGPPV
ncbi:hypothetical protein F0562_029371 [Nyssa sinensis]|uniref:RING-type E3 ubiquitin transferase n=1 Tax=Nyssa sinensis TaxID=561372 RepID=A0A5J5B0W6_9ASTE|nr:hypothetical protein F0562_029371 [Nyssa sinensis]